MIEIDPHSALSGPFKQICALNKFDHLSYVPTLVRKCSDTDQILSVAGSLFLAGYPVDLAEVNSHIYGGDKDRRITPRARTKYLLVDLPPYQLLLLLLFLTS